MPIRLRAFTRADLAGVKLLKAVWASVVNVNFLHHGRSTGTHWPDHFANDLASA
jgi:hypothetical protein